MNSIITIKEYLEKGKTFVVPEFQRGYVWGKNRPHGQKDSVSYIMDDLIARFPQKRESFLQGVTVCESKDEIVLIDGQQRTTFLYLLLKYLGYKGDIKLRYDVGREKSKEFLENLSQQDLGEIIEADDDRFQDLHFFKKSIRIIREKLKSIDNIDSFLQYILERVRFLYIQIPDPKQARQVFTMMNGNKAEMRVEELIKSELLRVASLDDADQDDPLEAMGHEWERLNLRGRLAREWDRWLRWWNQEEVQQLFRCKKPMGLLVESYLGLKKGAALSLESFKEKCLQDVTPTAAEIAHEGLRKLQKQFEDAFENPVEHNQIGTIFALSNEDGRQSFIKWFFPDSKHNNLELYYNLVVLGMSHKECAKVADTEDILSAELSDVFRKKYEEAERWITDEMLYEHPDSKEFACRWLLKLNVDEDCYQNHFFTFAIWGRRSLEHICPQTKVKHKGENGEWLDGKNQSIVTGRDYLLREKIPDTTEHGIGNLVLLYNNENSALSDKSFNDKKKKLFSPRAFHPDTGKPFESRHLLHTIFVFAELEAWNEQAISNNMKKIVENFRNTYESIERRCREKQD